VLTTMPSHSFGWYYIYLRLFAGLIRSIAMPSQWLGMRKYKIPEGVVVKRIAVPSRDKGRNIEVHLYQPAGHDSTKPTPALINFHGSVISPWTAAFKVHVSTAAQDSLFRLLARIANSVLSLPLAHNV
jgi:poly(3-hydroxybutyrate) depolymerase